MIWFHSLAHEGAGAIGAVSLLIILKPLTGCAEGPPRQTAVLAKPDRRLEIYGVRTYQDKKGVLVTGSVRGPPLLTGAIWGHLHVEGLFDDRRPPIAVDTRWGTAGRFPAFDEQNGWVALAKVI